METLASLFVSLVVAANAFVPQVDLADRLGVVQGQPDVLSETAESDLSIEARDRVRDAIRTAEERRTEAASRIQDKRRETQDRLTDKREEFQERLSNLRDERKAQVLENVDRRLSSILTRWISHWNNVLSRLDQILAKVTTRAERLAQNGVDVSVVNSAIDSAEAAIARAQEQIDELAGKDYVFEVGEEASLGEDVRTFLASFKEDMRTVSEAVKSAREAVHQAIRSLNSVIPDTQNDEE